jgi:ABC-type lipoprotein release transport system permease subunit
MAVITHAVARAVRASAVGLAGGAVLALLASRLIAVRLYGVGWIDPVTAVAGVLVLAVLTIVAAWLPAMRATRVDPTIALRAD